MEDTGGQAILKHRRLERNMQRSWSPRETCLQANTTPELAALTLLPASHEGASGTI